MASTGFLLFMSTVIFFGFKIVKCNSFVQVHSKTQIIGQYDQQTRLDCIVHPSESVKEPEIKVVIWTKEGEEEPLLFYNRGKLTPSSGYSFAEPSWNKKNMNVSLLIHKTAVKDEGVYKCLVYTDSGYNFNHTSLRVTAKYTVPSFLPHPTTIDLNTDGTLTCKSTGYPKGQLCWFDKDGNKWTKSPETEVLLTESGLYSLSSTLTLQRGSIFSQYVCKVFNAAGDKEAEDSFTVPDKPVIGGLGQEGGPSTSTSTSTSNNLATKIVAPLVVIGSLIVGLLLALLYRRRYQSNHRAIPTREQEVEEGDSREMQEFFREKTPSGETV
ncbi:butyrophilin subfamily 2 member A2 isoform X2 [Cheilinus undulatus]|uniref:butyrophilin subfamily 2 member A2 isoform X2 n=1 Tax=Cheilinus undulatus TaxID=241271 RepID=UPI001BD57837|nr:butyrophilin subfamily 2 member A2 isoform X2 [Cheilinus undulatus]